MNKSVLITKTRKLKRALAVLAHVNLPPPQKYPFPSDGQSAPVRHVKCHLGTQCAVVILRYEFYQFHCRQSQWLWRWWRWWCVWQMCQIWFGLSSTSQLVHPHHPQSPFTHTHIWHLYLHILRITSERVRNYTAYICKRSHSFQLVLVTPPTIDTYSRRSTMTLIYGDRGRQQQANTHMHCIAVEITNASEELYGLTSQ